MSKGVSQGDVPSPILFNLYLSRQAGVFIAPEESEYDYGSAGPQFSDDPFLSVIFLQYDDDIAYKSLEFKKLDQEMYRDSKNLAGAGLIMNHSKKEAKIFNSEQLRPRNLKYLISNINTDADITN